MTRYTGDGIYPRRLENAEGQVTWLTFHPGIDRLVHTIDPNGVVNETEYDGFGRPRRVIPDGGMVVRSRYFRDTAATAPDYGFTVRTEADDGSDVYEESAEDIGRLRSSTMASGARLRPPCYSYRMRETGWPSLVVCSVLRRMAPLALGGWMVIAGCSDGEEGGQDGGGNAAGSGGTPGSGGIGGAGDTGGVGDTGGMGETGGMGALGGVGDAGRPSDGGAGAGGGAGVGSYSCPRGTTWRPISLVAPATLPELEDLPLPEVASFAEVLAAGDGLSNSARLDVCEADDGTPTLGGVLLNTFQFELPTLLRTDPEVSSAQRSLIELEGGAVEEWRVPPADFLVSGLAEALAGNYDGFSVRVVHEQGVIFGGGNGVVAFAKGNIGASSVDYNSIYFVVGTLQPGDVFADLVCPFGEVPLSTSFSFDTANFDVEACKFLDVGHTFGYRITAMAVEDANSSLSGPEQQRHELDGVAAVEAAVTYRYNHHNACDSFHMALPHADYAATTAPMAGCGVAVANAPSPDNEDEGGKRVKFRIRYHGGEWTEGQISDCVHYFSCSGQL